MELKKHYGIFAGLLLTLGSAPLLAMPISLGDFSGSETVEDFSGLPASMDLTNPFTLNGVTYTSADTWMNQSGGFLFDNIPGTSLGTTLNTGTVGDFSISFASGVDRVGLLLSSGNSTPESWSVSILDSMSNVIETSIVSQPGLLDATFVGFQSSESIFGISVDNINSDSYFTFIDDLRYETASVPEPASLIILTAGLVGLGVVRRKTK